MNVPKGNVCQIVSRGFEIKKSCKFRLMQNSYIWHNDKSQATNKAMAKRSA